MNLAPHLLGRWEAPVADAIATTDRTPRGPVAQAPIVVEAELDPPIAQTIVHALERADMANILSTPNAELDTYPWYRELPRLLDVRPTITIAGERYSPDEIPDRPEGGVHDHRPERIALDLDLELNGRPYPGFGSIIGIETDLILLSPAESWIDEVRALVTPDATLLAHELVDILRYAYFAPGDSLEAGPWGNQLDEFLFHARHVAHRTLADEDTARRETITEALNNELLWLIPDGRRTDITIDENGRVDVRFAAP